MEPSEAVRVLPLELEPDDMADSEALLTAEVVVEDCDVAVAIGMTAVFVSCWSTPEALEGWMDAAVEAEVAMVVWEIWTDEGELIDAFAEEPLPAGDCEPRAAPLPKPVGRLYGQLVCTVASPGPNWIGLHPGRCGRTPPRVAALSVLF